MRVGDRLVRFDATYTGGPSFLAESNSTKILKKRRSCSTMALLDHVVLLIPRRLALLCRIGQQKKSDSMKNYNGGRIFSTLSNGDVSISRNLQERRR